MDTKKFPITPEQLELLQKRQRLVGLHPYTCEICGRRLIPTITGWYCDNDTYTQNWYNESDVDESFIEEFEEEARKNYEKSQEMLEDLISRIGN